MKKRTKKEFWFWWGQPVGVAIVMIITILTLLVMQSDAVSEMIEKRSEAAYTVECVGSE